MSLWKCFQKSRSIRPNPNAYIQILWIVSGFWNLLIFLKEFFSTFKQFIGRPMGCRLQTSWGSPSDPISFIHMASYAIVIDASCDGRLRLACLIFWNNCTVLIPLNRKINFLEHRWAADPLTRSIFHPCSFSKNQQGFH